MLNTSYNIQFIRQQQHHRQCEDLCCMGQWYFSNCNDYQNGNNWPLFRKQNNGNNIKIKMMSYKTYKNENVFCLMMLCKCGLCHHAVCVCVSVCVSITFVDSVKTNKRIFKICWPSGSHTILVFPYQTAWQYSNGNHPNEGVERRRGRQKSRFWANTGFIACC